MEELNFFVDYVDINFNSITIMINYFALTVTEMGIGKIELAVIGAVILISVSYTHLTLPTTTIV